MENEHYAGKRREGTNTEEHADTSTWKAAAALAKYEKTVDTLPQVRWRRELVFAEVVRLEYAVPHWPVGYEVPKVPGAGLRKQLARHGAAITVSSRNFYRNGNECICAIPLILARVRPL